MEVWYILDLKKNILEIQTGPNGSELVSAAGFVLQV
jgi:hypothetical protein